jgi:hypothetical protein
MWRCCGACLFVHDEVHHHHQDDKEFYQFEYITLVNLTLISLSVLARLIHLLLYRVLFTSWQGSLSLSLSTLRVFYTAHFCRCRHCFICAMSYSTSRCSMAFAVCMDFITSVCCVFFFEINVPIFTGCVVSKWKKKQNKEAH